MYKLRITYSKTRESIYLSHLDIMDVFEKSFRRANIDIEYTHGFSPKPDMVFAHPLSVGIESIGEIFEVMLKEKLDTKFVIKQLNIYLPKSITILKAKYINLKEKNIMSRVYAATYVISIDYDTNLTVKEQKELSLKYKSKLDEYLNQEHILVLKISKNRNERIDIKQNILNYSFTFDNNLELTLTTGSKCNLKPELFVNGFIEYIGIDLNYDIRREKILFK
ncbi:MAG: TIGR03936 family radical SAM-associated protein [Clostridia bacterium]